MFPVDSHVTLIRRWAAVSSLLPCKSTIILETSPLKDASLNFGPLDLSLNIKEDGLLFMYSSLSDYLDLVTRPSLTKVRPTFDLLPAFRNINLGPSLSGDTSSSANAFAQNMHECSLLQLFAMWSFCLHIRQAFDRSNRPEHWHRKHITKDVASLSLQISQLIRNIKLI